MQIVRMGHKKSLEFILPFLGFLHLLLGVKSEFRFCSQGPHRIKDGDCPGGFFAKRAINVTCAYYAADSLPEGSTPQVVENYCESTNPVALTVAGEKVSVQTMQEFVLNSVDLAASSVSPGNFTPENVCVDECFGDWKNPDQVYPEDHLEDRPGKNGTQSNNQTNNPLAERAKELSKEIFMMLLNSDVFEEDDPGEDIVPLYDPLWNINTSESRLIILLSQSMQIVWGNCNPYVEDTFLRQVLKSMMFLQTHNQRLTPDIGVEDFHIISDILEKCKAQPNSVFRLKGSSCSNFHRVDSVHYLKKGETWKYRLQARSFVWGMYDPIIEAAWSAVNFVHGYCFPHFIDNVTHLHMYEVAMEFLFPESPVMLHWTNPVNISKALWNTVLETEDIQVTMMNLDACVTAGYASAPFQHRLERPFTTEIMLAEPQYTPVDVDANKGWTKSAQNYWARYDALGGFRALSKEWGFCLQEPLESETKESMVNDIKAKSCT